MSKERVVRLRVSGSEADRWVEAAYVERVSLSEWLRQAANARVAGRVLAAVEDAVAGAVVPGSRSVVGPGDMPPLVKPEARQEPEPYSKPEARQEPVQQLETLKPLARQVKPDPRKKR